MMNTNMIAVQEALEEEALGLSMKRYREALAARGEDALPPGMKLVKKSLEPLIGAISQYIADGLAGKASRNVSTVQYLQQFDVDAIAFMTARICIHHIGQPVSLQKVAFDVALRIEGMLNYEELAAELKAQDPRKYRDFKEKLSKTGSGERRFLFIRKEQKVMGMVRVKWERGEKLRLGLLLVHMMAEATGLIAIVTKNDGGKRQITLVESTPATTEWLAQSHSRCELLTPVFMPMVTRPTPWSSPWGGGYLSKKLQFPLIKTSNKNYLEELSYTDMPMVYNSINTLQDTQWQINKGVLSVLLEVWDGGGSLGKLPYATDKPLPGWPVGLDRDNPEKTALQAFMRDTRRAHEENEYNAAKRSSLVPKLWLGEKFSQFDSFHFVYSLDWRGRAYPVASGINPQGDDVAKGLLRFTEGKALGPNGAYWLAVHGANCFGVDKVTFDERVQWIGEHTSEILESAMNPLNGSRFWSTADAPYQFLAFCMEWAGYTMEGDNYVSHLSVSFDGTCNGLQNFSAMLRDEVGGARVGLVPMDAPTDIYSLVRDRANELIAVDAAGGLEIAQKWAGKITRGLTKANTMTTPYGVSRYGMGDQVMNALNKMKQEGELTGVIGFADAQYIASINYAAISECVVSARTAMDWLQEVAKVVAANDLPISWVTPSGLPVLQSYREMIGKRYNFHIEGKRYQMVLKVTGDKLDRRKQSSGISPNFVHSLDAAHMCRTVAYCAEAGIKSFAMIHDSYGAPAADAETLIHELRRAFVDQYSVNVLKEFRDQIVEGLPDGLANKVPGVPLMGNLDLNVVLDSEYFFA